MGRFPLCANFLRRVHVARASSVVLSTSMRRSVPVTFTLRATPINRRPCLSLSCGLRWNHTEPMRVTFTRSIPSESLCYLPPTLQSLFTDHIWEQKSLRRTRVFWSWRTCTLAVCGRQGCCVCSNSLFYCFYWLNILLLKIRISVIDKITLATQAGSIELVL